ncbi:hypothetical protein QEG98_03100 [Myxococcus sp. MxC21-1]|uniref:hypothetical protein n=1 Tax=Myxococcus sp. MxC21-1 TaxID=3041439 RepID=UPI00292CE526|nr:hypothetical protein [Myxococcus sp. MxC21-1]WNZ62821.1 hypothetical protein QEG98_03100 [Myxococcus sp. MxC21-1]
MGAWKQTVAALVSAVSMVGCAGNVTEPVALRSGVAELAAPNGRNLNGRNLNGRNLNTSELGQLLVSVDLAGARIAEEVLGAVRLEERLPRRRLQRPGVRPVLPGRALHRQPEQW